MTIETIVYSVLIAIVVCMFVYLKYINDRLEEDEKFIDEEVEILNRALHETNEIIDKQYSTILHLEQEIIEYQNMDKVKRIKG